ncbi:MAG: N-acetyl sugar amidotransferase [Candidatus Omnitrophica bacterium]|nr:N-acetyl sugar amidotransferase [Candidatus Omnitrophota bacterium]
MMDLKRCSRCVMPETHETIFYDDEGVCNICRQHELKHEKIDWDKRKQEFVEIVDRYRGKGAYDCIIPISGGKDSTYVLYMMMKKYKVKPLAVSFDHGFYRPHHIKNRDKVLRKLGVDLHLFRSNQKVVKKLMLESLKRKGDFCWHCHTGVFAYPMQIAVKHNIPLLIWGESTAEYTSYYSFDEPDERDEEAFNKWINLGITAEDMEGMLDGSVTMRDLEPYRYPRLRDLNRIGYRSICYGTYHPWDVRKHVDVIQKELGWEVDEVEGVPSDYWYTKLECMFSGVRDYLKFLKRGFGRTTQLATDDVRAGVITREEALTRLRQNDGLKPASLGPFLEFIGITEDEFNEIAARHMVSPWKCDPKKIRKGKTLHDQEDWNLSGVNEQVIIAKEAEAQEE